MAESAVKFLIGNIVTLLEKEASFLGEVRHEIIEIKRELESMRSFLNYADRRGESDDPVRTWVEQVRDVAYDVEDIIDEFMYQMGSQRKNSGFTGFIRKTVYLPSNLWVRHQIATKLQDIDTQIKAISERSKRYVLVEEVTNSHDSHGWLQHHGESSLFIEDDELVGIESKRDLLLNWLMEGESQRTVISVCGMGGSGKTTLMAKVYKSEDVKRYFNCYAWITVSQTYTIEDIFRSMIKEFFESKKESVPVDLTTLDYRRLLDLLVNYLQQKRYMVVLDDVWNPNLWSQINVALPEGGRGSRIMLTTRKEDIASSSFGVGSHVHQIQPLKESEAWTLFCKKAFSNDSNRCCPPKLEVLARLIVEKCEGLPLAVVAMGGLMSSKTRTDSEWRSVYDSLNWELSNNPRLEVIKSILLLSYKDLPYYLKHCFLYCCVFPEDHLIRRKRLIRLWVAEGFVEERRGMTLEEVADNYLMELISRSMLHVTERNHFGRPKRCRMHDLMRELALSISERENFCVVYDEQEEREDCRARRLSIQNKSDANIQFRVSMSQLRSFFVFIKNMISPPSWNGLPLGFRLLRVLDLEGVPIERVPDELTNLFNLRYLSLRETRVKELPKSLGRLQNLITLDLKDSKVEALPSGIVKLRSLRHLKMDRCNHGDIDAYNIYNGAPVPVGVCKLKNLQLIEGMEATGDIIEQLGNMTQLTKIGITKVKEADGIELCTSIGKMNLLHELTVAAIEEESLRMDTLSSPPPRLRRLGLVGKLEKVPLWFCYLENLTALFLNWSQLREDPFPHIQALPNLGYLVLSNAYDGQQLHFHAGSFLKLKWLYLRNLPHLNQVIIEKEAMPSIQELYLIKCRELKMVPEGIEHLTSLEKLYLLDASEELIMRLHEEESVDRPKVQHIPEIDHYFETVNGGMFYESLSSYSVNTS